MSKVFLAFFAALLLLAGAFALLSLGQQAAAFVPPCRNAIDDDGDTTINDGCPALVDGLTSPAKTSEGVNPNECNETAGNAMDDDSDGAIAGAFNDGCPQVGAAAEAACNDQVDDDPGDDPDGYVNDGCPKVGLYRDCDSNSDGDCADAGEIAKCLDSGDDDGDGVANDGCPMWGSSAETDAQCTDTDDDDEADDPDGVINDGCPPVGTQKEDGWQCSNSLDDDGDTVVNDGCGGGPAAAGPAGQPETIDSCTNATDDDDMDGVVNDGCPTVDTNPEPASVGGLAELPDVAGDSGSSAGTYAALAGGLAAAVLALGAGAWYARRRWVR